MKAEESMKLLEEKTKGFVQLAEGINLAKRLIVGTLAKVYMRKESEILAIVLPDLLGACRESAEQREYDPAEAEDIRDAGASCFAKGLFYLAMSELNFHVEILRHPAEGKGPKVFYNTSSSAIAKYCPEIAEA